MTTYASGPPQRVMVVPASAGGEHDSATGTLSEVIAGLWPETRVQCSDVLGNPNRVVRGLLRRFARTAPRLLGVWSGAKLGPHIDRAAPDMILSTHPVATAGLAWLRRKRGLTVPLGVTHAQQGEHGDVATHIPLERPEHALRTLHERPVAPRPRPLRPEDALFLHVDTASVPQQVGTVLVFAPSGGEPAPTRSDVVRLLRAVPGISGQLRGPGMLRRAQWVPDESITPWSLVDETDLITRDCDLDSVVDEFFSLPLAPPHVGQARLVSGLPDGGRAILVKLHHALGDGITVLRALLSGTDAAHRAWAAPPVTPVGHAPRPRPARLVRGLWNLAGAGTAPRYPTATTVTSPARHHRRVSLPDETVRRLARSFDISSSEVLHTLFAEAAHRTFGSGANGSDELRLMIPWSLRGTAGLRAAGNVSGALSVDLPVGPMAPVQRARHVSATVRRGAAGGTPEVAGAVVRSLGYLPPPLHRLAARLTYRATWFNAIGTVLPGPRWDVRLNDAQLTTAYPVLPLAPGIGIAWGAMTWGKNIAVCVTGSASHRRVVDTLASQLRAVFDELSGTAPETAQGSSCGIHS